MTGDSAYHEMKHLIIKSCEIPDRRAACAVAVQYDPALGSEQQRVARFTATTGASRATYFRIKAKLAAAF